VPIIGALFCDYKMGGVGVVNNILGPVKTPYISIKPVSNVDSALVGRVLYQVEKD